MKDPERMAGDRLKMIRLPDGPGKSYDTTMRLDWSVEGAIDDYVW